MILLATAARGTADLVAADARRLGLDVRGVRRDGVLIEAEPAAAARALVWMRVATRLLVLLDEVPCHDADALYEALTRIDWPDWLSDRHTIAVHCSGTLPSGAGTRGPPITNHVFAAQRCKDAICDRLRLRYGARPNVDVDDPDVRVVVRFAGDWCTVALDLAGEPLHRRGYRVPEAEAPLKESLAAAMALASGWDGGRPLLDPMCGSGTLLIEAVSAQLGLAPGATRDFSVERWPWHGRTLGTLLDAERAAAADHAAAQRAKAKALNVLGLDFDRGAVRIARMQVERAGLAEAIRIERGDARKLDPPPPGTLILSNPPYGVRLGAQDVTDLYGELGRRWAGFADVEAWLVDGHPRFVASFGHAPLGAWSMNNGALPVTLRRFAFEGVAPMQQARQDGAAPEGVAAAAASDL